MLPSLLPKNRSKMEDLVLNMFIVASSEKHFGVFKTFSNTDSVQFVTKFKRSFSDEVTESVMLTDFNRMYSLNSLSSMEVSVFGIWIALSFEHREICHCQ